MGSMLNMLAVNAISRCQGLNAKLAKLATQPDLKKALYYCYNPFYQFYIKTSDAWLDHVGTQEFEDQTWLLLDKLRNRELTGKAAKLAVFTELRRLEPLSQYLLMRILNKDMCFGLQAKSINKVWPGLIPAFEVQLAKLYDPTKAIYPCFASPKIDGLRCVYQNGKLLSRYGKEFVGLDHIVELLKDLQVTRIDGEITVEGMKFDDLSGEIRSFHETDNAIYNIFDIHTKANLRLDERLEILEQIPSIIGVSKSIQIVPHIPVNSEDEAFRWYQEYRDQGYEGLMLKKIAQAFNGRNNDWMKIKPRDTVDILVTGTLPGKGALADKVGTLVCDLNGYEVHVGGGLSLQQRIEWQVDPNLIVGKTVEVEFMEKSKNGALRHPRLKCVRGDK